MSPPDKEQILQSLQQVGAIRDPLEREYAVLSEAQRLGLPLDVYRRLMLARDEQSWSQEWLLRSASRLLDGLERRLKAPTDWLRQRSFTQLCVLFGQFSILGVTVSYLLDAPVRYQQHIRELRAETTASTPYRYSTTRIRDLQLLAHECEGWPGLEVEGTELAGINLGPCRRFHPTLASFRRLPPALFTEEGFDLSHARLSRTNLRGANLRGANLSGANLEKAILQDADLRGADLRGASLQEAHLEGAWLDGAQLRDASLDGAHLEQARLDNADLYDARLTGANLVWASLRGANLSRARLTGANLTRADLRDADLFHVDLERATLLKADLRRACTIGLNLPQARLDRVQLSASDQLQDSPGWSGTPLPIASEELPRLGLIRDGDQDAFFQDVLIGMREALSARGSAATIETCETDGSPDVIARERECVDMLISRGVDALAIAPRHPVASMAALLAAYHAGVAIACYDRCVGEEGLRYISGDFQSDQVELGRRAGEALVRWLSAHGRRNQELRLGILHCGSNENCYRRYVGFRSVLDQERIPWSVLALRGGWTPENAQAPAAEIVANPGVDVLWSANGAGTEALVNAAAVSPRRERLVVLGTDINPTLARMLLSAEPPAFLLAVSGQSPRQMGGCAVAATLARLNRQGPEALPAPCRTRYTPSILYSREAPAPVRKFLNQEG